LIIICNVTFCAIIDMVYPKITIVTVSYNSRDYIGECIQSVVNQGYPALEYIIVDGGSTDGTLDIIEKYRAKIASVITEADKGPADALNKGFAVSTGEIMGWLNSDDRLQPNALFAVAEIFNAQQGVNWVMGFPTWYSADGICVNEIPYPRNKFYYSPAYISDNLHAKFARWSKWRFAVGDYSSIQQESTFWRRSLWQKAGAFVRQNTIAYDLELWTRFFEHDKLHTAMVLLAGFRMHGNQISVNQKDLYRTEANGFIESFKKKIAAQNPAYKLARVKLASLLKVFYYYEIPVLKSFYPYLLDLPPYIFYDNNKKSFLLAV
jgi:glycosyltransferase involved in cell wall biosynthesis